MQLFHHTVVNQLGGGKIDDDVVLAYQPNLLNLSPKRNKVGEDRRPLRIDQNGFFIQFLDLKVGHENGGQGQTVVHVNGQFHSDTNCDSDQQISGEHSQHSHHKDNQLLASRLVDVDELCRRCKPKSSVNEHSSQSRQRYAMDKAWQKRNKREQQDSVPKISESRSCAVIDVGFASNNFGNHRQATYRSSYRICDPHSHKIAIQIGFASPRVNHVNCFCTEHRLERTNQGEHHNPLYRQKHGAGFGEHTEIRKCHGTE